MADLQSHTHHSNDHTLTDTCSNVVQHDKNLAASGIDIWIGAEPTFTLRASEEPEWLSQALGEEKYRYALRLAAELQRRHPGSLVLRTVGRQYGGEDVPRWSIGLLKRRDDVPVWQGPPDPVCAPDDGGQTPSAAAFLDALQAAFADQQWSSRRLLADGTAELRMLLRTDAGHVDEIDDADQRLHRSSVHAVKTPESGLTDPLSDIGYSLFSVGERVFESGQASLWIELPAFSESADFLRCLDAVGTAARNANVHSLVIKGFPPPVDATVSWTTITPDPAVIEINQAPEPTLERFDAASREIFRAAERQGLATYRLQYNGAVADSGGGGQFTLGGRTTDNSPFFRAPQLLPRMIRYFNRHPSLSYWFAPDNIGSASQSPRADEGTRDAFYELGVALEQLERQADVSPAFLGASLSPFLTDPSGNAHRSELNIEKLWNPDLPGRGCLGLLEFRAFRMPQTATDSTAIALLLRSLVGMLAQQDTVPTLTDWADELHDRFALPFFLRQDLQQVLQDLDTAGFALPGWAEKALLQEPTRSSWSVDFDGCRLALSEAVEFWPLVGDVASQESGGSRLVDSSTLRMQISLTGSDADNSVNLRDWQLQTAGYRIPLNPVADDDSNTQIIGLRYRDFAPWRGLHPGIAPVGPLAFALSHPSKPDAIAVSLHGWRPEGTAYDGLPKDLQEAAARRRERLRVSTIAKTELPVPRDPPPETVKPWSFDIRRLPPI